MQAPLHVTRNQNACLVYRLCMNVIKCCFFSLKTELSSDSDFEDEPTSPKKPPEPVIDLSKDDDTNLEVTMIIEAHLVYKCMFRCMPPCYWSPV